MIPEPVDAETTRERIREMRERGYSIRDIALAADRPPVVVSVLDLLRWVSPATEAAIERAAGQLAEKGKRQ